MPNLAAIVYPLCFFSSSLCAYLLVNAYRRSRDRLLLWSAACFCLLSLNNLLVFIDIVALRGFSLSIWRLSASLLAIAVLLYGFIWEMD